MDMASWKMYDDGSYSQLQELETSWHINICIYMYIHILACTSKGMSNNQIAPIFSTAQARSFEL